MQMRNVAVGVTALCLTAGGAGAALAAKGTPPKHATINAVTNGTKYKINKYAQDTLRWQKDVYQVRSGGTLTIVNNAPSEGPHTFSVVNKKDLPRTTKQLDNCLKGICGKIAQEHGANPQSEAPPAHFYTEDGVGQDTPPNVDKPGDSAFIAPVKGAKVTLTVTAKKGTTLYFMCAVHPWMQAKVIVG